MLLPFQYAFLSRYVVQNNRLEIGEKITPKTDSPFSTKPTLIQKLSSPRAKLDVPSKGSIINCSSLLEYFSKFPLKVSSERIGMLENSLFKFSCRNLSTARSAAVTKS